MVVVLPSTGTYSHTYITLKKNTEETFSLTAVRGEWCCNMCVGVRMRSKAWKRSTVQCERRLKYGINSVVPLLG